MNIKVLILKYNNIRGVKNLEISFEKKQNCSYKTSLVMMRNGTGKTTTLNLLRAILDGTAEKWDEEKVKSFDPKILGQDKGYFEAKLKIDEKIFFVTLNLDYQSGKAFYNTSRAGEVGGGLEPGHLIPKKVREVFSDEFVKRFIFNGELAKEILNTKSNEAEKAMRFLYHLNKIEEMRGRADTIIEEEQKKHTKTKIVSSQGLAAAITRRDNLSNMSELLKEKTNGLESKVLEYEDRIKQIENYIDNSLKADKETQEEYTKVENQKNEVISKIKDLSQKMIDNYKNPEYLNPLFSRRLHKLSDNMQKLKLPESTSKQFFEEIAEEKKCICGNPITEKEKQYILKTADKFLGQDQLGLLNAIKSTIRDREFKNIIEVNNNDMQILIEEKNDIFESYNRLKATLKESGNEEIVILEGELEEITQKLSVLKRELNEIKTTETQDLIRLSWNNNFYLCDQALKEAEAKVAEATNTIELKRRAEKVKIYLKNIEEVALEKLKKRIISDTNKKLEQIVRTENLIVEKIDGHLKLLNKDGASEGQSLAIAYSYLGSLFAASDHQLPFVVDSPAGSLDLDVRREVSNFLPQLFDQLIIFITSGERDGFAENFYKLNEKEVQFLTVINDSKLPTEIISGKNTFQDFQFKELESMI